MMARNFLKLRYLLLLVAALYVTGCGMYDDQPLQGESGPEWDTRRAQLTDFCSVRVDGYGKLSVEDEYLAQVVTCEDGGAPLEALKAQAIAARGYAKYVADVEGRSLSPSTRDQSYNCGRPITAAARRAVKETSGMVLTHNGKIIMPFYVAGSTRVNHNTCMASGSAGTQRYVTYNHGRIGSRVHTTSLGWSGSPANRGAMSQNGANCLAHNGWKAQRILRYFYGDDIRVAQLPGQCVDHSATSDSGAAGGTSGGTGDPASDGSTIDTGSTGGSSDAPTCDSNAAQPHIIPRSAWGAAPSRYNRPHHTPKMFTIHHTVTSNHDTTPKATIRAMQRYHMNKGWGDIGFHYVIDQQGRIYGTYPVDRMGAHVAGHNRGNIGIGFLGDYRTLQPTEKQLAAAGKLIRYLAKKYNISVSSSTVKGHNDFNATLCPGANLDSKIGRIIRYAKGEDLGCDDGSGSSGSSTYQYVRVRATSDVPLGDNDTIDGFELDSVFTEASDGTRHMAGSVTSSSGTTNANAALGAPDNDSCDNRSSTVAGISTTGQVVVKISGGFKPGDVVHVVQANYNVAMADCAPSGAAQVAISKDGQSWTVLQQDVSGNAALRVNPSFIEFSKPGDGSTQNTKVDFAVNASSDIVKVKYVGDGSVGMGSSTTGPHFPVTYTFIHTGTHSVVAKGLDSSGNVVATAKISVTIQQSSGGGGGGGGTGGMDSTMASKLGTQGGQCSGVGNGGGGARCHNGRGGYSTGSCWAYVKAAIIRSGLATRADINTLASRVGLSGYSVQVSAAGFKRAADRASAATLASTMHLKKVSTPPTQAPRGAIIAWGAGCMGYNARYGHIEIAQGDGYACSDFCGHIKGNASCGSVYVPVN